jgi:hypothetical protein
MFLCLGAPQALPEQSNIQGNGTRLPLSAPGLQITPTIEVAAEELQQSINSDHIWANITGKLPATVIHLCFFIGCDEGYMSACVLCT